MARNKSEKELRSERYELTGVSGFVTLIPGESISDTTGGDFTWRAEPKAELIASLQRMGRKIRKVKRKVKS